LKKASTGRLKNVQDRNKSYFVHGEKKYTMIVKRELWKHFLLV